MGGNEAGSTVCVQLASSEPRPAVQAACVSAFVTRLPTLTFVGDRAFSQVIDGFVAARDARAIVQYRDVRRIYASWWLMLLLFLL